MVAVQRPFDTSEELHEAELECFRAMFDSGPSIAALAALHYCGKHAVKPPQWAVQEAAAIYCANFGGNKKSGRSKGIINRYRQDMIDYARRDCVVEVRENHKLLREKAKALHVLTRRPVRELRKELMEKLGAGGLDAFQHTSMLLAKTASFGGPDAIKKSYRTVEGNLSDPVKCMRYRILDPEFLRKVGVSDPLLSKRGLRKRQRSVP